MLLSCLALLLDLTPPQRARHQIVRRMRTETQQVDLMPRACTERGQKGRLGANGTGRRQAKPTEWSSPVDRERKRERTERGDHGQCRGAGNQQAARGGRPRPPPPHGGGQGTGWEPAAGRARVRKVVAGSIRARGLDTAVWVDA